MTIKQNKSARNLAVLAIILFSGMIFVISFLSINSADDYWYSAFMSGSAKDYFAMMKYHYETFNGRMIVHFIAQLILHFPKIGFGVFSALFAFFTPFIASALFELDEDKTIIVISLFQGFILLLPHRIMIDAYLWVSAFANYAIPVLLIVLTLLVLKNVYKNRRNPWYLYLIAYILVFICGATTEQNGLCMVGACILISGFCIIKSKKHIPFSIICTALSIVGVLSIFFSPATYQRMGRETTGEIAGVSFVQATFNSITNQTDCFAGYYFIIFLVIALLTLISSKLYKKHRNKPLLVFCIALPVLLVLGIVSNIDTVKEICYLTLLLVFTLLPAIVYLIDKKYILSLLSIMAVCSLVIMVFTQSNGSRTFLPFSIYLYIMTAAEFSVLIASLKRYFTVISIGAVAVLACCAFGVAVPHYVYNFLLENHNVDKIIEGVPKQTVELSIDYDMEYTYDKFFNNNLYYQRYLECYGIDPNVITVKMVSEYIPDLYLTDDAQLSLSCTSDLTREEYIQVLFNFAGQNKKEWEGPTGFTDIPEGAYFSSAVNWANANGICAGICDGSFGVGQKVTRELFVTLLMRTYGLNNDTSGRADLSNYVDLNQVSPWAVEPFEWAIANKITYGTSPTKLSPQMVVNRAAAARLFINLNNTIKKK